MFSTLTRSPGTFSAAFSTSGHSLRASWTKHGLHGANRRNKRAFVRTPLLRCSAEATGARKLIAKSDIPVIFPRTDFTLQLFRWAKIEAEDGGLQNFGSAFTVEPVFKDPSAPEEEAELWGFDAFILRDGEPVCQVGVYMDREKTEKPEFIGIGESGFPVNEGRIDVIEGKSLEIWKIGAESVDEDMRSVLRRFCDSLNNAIETYAAFGSCFSDDG